jgi:hypothetical protein
MRQLVVLATCVAAVLATAGVAQGQTTVVRAPVDDIVEACGEVVHVTGTVLLLGNVSAEDPGLFLLSRAVTQDLTGTGLTSGTTYRGTITSGRVLTAGPGPAETSTHVTTIVLAGQGQAPNLVAHTTFHLNVTPSGEYGAFVAVQHVECR